MEKRIRIFLSALLLLCFVCILPGCGLFDAFAGKVPTTYDRAELYTPGDAEFEGKVDTFYLYWLDGSVTIKTHKEDTVVIRETANRDTEDNFRLHWRYYDAGEYGNVLTIYYSASGNFDYGDLKKDITVYIPENEDMNISVTSQTASVDVDISEFDNMLEELSIVSYSGKVSAKVDSADQVRISGQNDEGIPEEAREFSFQARGVVYDLGISASYAKVDVVAAAVRNGEVGTVFADLDLAVEETKKLTIQNSAGKITATVLEFETLDIETFDNTCRLTLSLDASFALTMKEKDRFNHKVTPKTVSVEFDDVTRDGMCYTVGTGEKTITVATDSDLTIVPLIPEETPGA